jgi:hypothetical protein
MNILFYDNGLCTELAVSFARAGHTVKYHTPPWTSPFPKCVNSCIGLGLEGVERVQEFWPYTEEANLVVCPDTFSKDVVNECLHLGLPTFGAGEAEILEHDRSFTKQLMKRVGLPVGPYVEIKGITRLMDFLKTHDKRWVKINRFRGDIETFFHDNWPATLADTLGPLLHSFGAYAEQMDFVVEEPIESEVEIGFDGLVVNGGFSEPCLIGYEAKDLAYIGVFCKAPKIVSTVNDKLASFFRSKQTRSIYSTEIRIGKDGKGYLIDPCVRAPHPPLAAELEVYKNFPEAIIQAATKGTILPLEPVAKYVCAVEVKSDWVEDHWCELCFDPQLRKQIKLQQACKIGGKYYALPGSFVVATIVGMGPSIERAEANCIKAVEAFHCRGMTYDLDSLRKIRQENIPAGLEFGIEF